MNADTIAALNRIAAELHTANLLAYQTSLIGYRSNKTSELAELIEERMGL